MGITRFELYRPAALRGEVAVSLPDCVRLVVIAEPLPDANQTLWQDIIRSLSLSAAQVYCVTPEQAIMLPEERDYALWTVGEHDLSDSLAEHKPRLTSLSLAELADNPAAKRRLWQQICDHEHYFTADSQ